MKELILAAKAFSDPTRVRILSALRGRELCVCELCDVLKVTQSTLSTHLQVIRAAKLVDTRKLGKWSYYDLNPKAEKLLDLMLVSFSITIRKDSTLRRDAQQLRQRLSLRSNGACCIGFVGAKRTLIDKCAV